MRDTKAAFRWIVFLLRKHSIPFRISGGFAARVYGSKRPLADIDIDVPQSHFHKILLQIKPFIICGPKRYKDREWNLYLISLKYKGQVIDLAGTENEKIFDKNIQRWINPRFNVRNVTKKRVYGLVVPIIPKEELMAYKSKILRRVDKEDLRQLSG